VAHPNHLCAPDGGQNGYNPIATARIILSLLQQTKEEVRTGQYNQTFIAGPIYDQNETKWYVTPQLLATLVEMAAR
jgi:hypothetical protein